MLGRAKHHTAHSGEHLQQLLLHIERGVLQHIVKGVDVAGHQVVQQCFPQELQLLIAISQPVVPIARVGECLKEERLLFKSVSDDLLDLIGS